MQITVWDVEQGLAVHVESPNGKMFVVDLGRSDVLGGQGTKSPLDQLRGRGYGAKIDELIITHPHRDHLDEIANLGKDLSPKVLVRPVHLSDDEVRAGNREEDREIIDTYLRIHGEYHDPISEDENPESSQNNGGMKIRRFHPQDAATSNLNNHSIVTFFTYASSTVCVPGDNESPSWNELLVSSGFCTLLKQTDVFLASHHGGDSGFSKDVFEHCDPKLVVVSDGSATDTSAVARYGNVASGWPVHSRSTGSSTDRLVVTTRSDGAVEIKCGFNEPDEPFLAVYID